MTISPLSIQQIVNVIRQQMTNPVRPDSGTVATAMNRKPKSDATADKHGEQPKIQRRLDQLISQRMAAIPADDPDRRRKAFRLFLESVLLNELGENLLNDPGFAQLIDTVQLQMESMPETAATIQEATRLLLDGARPASRRKPV